MAVRRWVVILGDQLDATAQVLKDADPALDRIWMAETMGESTHVTSTKQRTALFLSAMRHFAKSLHGQGWQVQYQRIDDPRAARTLDEALRRDLKAMPAQEVVVTAPGEWRVLDMLRQVTRELGVTLTVLDDGHFFSTVRDFAMHAKGRKQLRMEFWYRELRKRFGILMDGDEPVGGQWNFDADNRLSFGKQGPQQLPELPRFEPDAITQEVIDWVGHQDQLPGHIDTFNWPVDRTQALKALSDFVQHRLPQFGPYEDAMWTGQPWLFHSLLSAALNLKLLSAREVVHAAEQAYRAGHVELASAEGFIRQILGWREYVRGVYWTQMPEYVERNGLNAEMPLPQVYWTAQTPMACLREVVGQTLRLGYAHHIQRLMVTGLYALLLGVRPQEVHAWYLGVYVDAVEWVELPNTLGMSQYGDGGVMASKPYIASGKYIDRMSNYCKGCAYKPQDSVGDSACPITTLYWDFLIRHEEWLARNPRMVMQVKNAKRLSQEMREQIQAQAESHRVSLNFSSVK